MRLNKLTKIIKISMKHIVSFLEKHPELGVVPMLSPNSTLNDKQVVAVIDFYKNEKNRPTMSYQEDSDNEFEITKEQTANQENDMSKISTVKFYPNIKVVGQIDLDALNQLTRPKKKTKEEKRKDREEKEKLRQEQRKKIKEDTIKAIRKNIDDKRIENNEKEATSKGEQKFINNIKSHKTNNKSNINCSLIHDIRSIAPAPNNSNIKVENSKIEVENHNIITISVNLNKLTFGDGFARLKFKNEVFVLNDSRLYKEFKKAKKDSIISKKEKVELVINKNTNSFFFTNKRIYTKIIQLGQELHIKNVEKKNKKIERQKAKCTHFIVHTNLMNFKFYDGIAYFFYNNEQFSFHDNKFIKDYNKLYKIAIKNKDCYKALNSKEIKLILNLSNKTFICDSGFNIYTYLELCLQKFSIKTPEPKYSKNNGNQDYLDHEQRINCKIENIEFFDRYYKIWIVENEKKVNNIQPLIITDPNSLECLQIVSKYFENRIPSDVMIVFTSKKVKKLENGFKLQEYVETLKKNKDIPSDWWNSYENREIKTLENYRKISYSAVNKEVSYKNIYIDYLTSYQDENPLLIAYEIFNGQEEKCFVFNVSINDKRSAIIYENININRATNVFIINKQDYEESLNLIFNYFTDEDLSRKRMSIRTCQNPPEKFKAIEIKTINHDNLNTWINKLNDLIVPVSQQTTDKTPEHIQFVSGLNIKNNNTERINTKEAIAVINLHDELKEKLYLQLTQKYGTDNVGTEVSIGHKKIDLVVKNQDSYDLYEIKTNQEVRICIREAMGQIIDYAFFECKDKVGKMTIVGPTQISQEASEYLKNIRNKHNLPIYYDSVN